MPFYVLCGYEDFGRIHTMWVNNKLTRHYRLSEETLLMHVVPLDEDSDTETRVQRRGLTTIPDTGPLLPQHFEQFPELEELVPKGSSIEDLNAAFEAATKEV